MQTISTLAISRTLAHFDLMFRLSGVFGSEGHGRIRFGGSFIDNNNNKFRIKTFRFCLFATAMLLCAHGLKPSV